MIKIYKKITEKQMLRSWALAESSSVRRWKYIKDILPTEILNKVQNNQQNFSEEEWIKLEEMIRYFRSPLLNNLLNIEMEWYKGVLPTSGLKDLEMMKWQPFIDLAGSRKLRDLVEAFLDGKMPPNHIEFAANLEKLEKNFDINKMSGDPVVVSRSIEPPYMLVEGFTRLSALLLNILENKLHGREIPVILGVSSRLEEWDFA